MDLPENQIAYFRIRRVVAIDFSFFLLVDKTDYRCQKMAQLLSNIVYLNDFLASVDSAIKIIFFPK